MTCKFAASFDGALDDKLRVKTSRDLFSTTLRCEEVCYKVEG